MSSRTRAHSARSRNSKASDRDDAPLANKDNVPGASFDPCAATASFFLYAQKNVITVLHHDTLAVERKFERHNEDVQFIAADNVSEKGGGRQIASYDAGQTVIVWDLFTGVDFARFASFEVIGAAAWMRDGNIAFGNAQGNIILFEPSTEEHSSTRTIFDPITAIAPASDSRTFAIGYQNGSVIVGTLQPTFTALHTLTTSRIPAPIIGLSWHGSSSKQKTDMLATQTADGDLRVWTVSKAPHSEQPRVIRALGSPEIANTRRNWFAWSKNGRIVIHSDGDTRAWDVRTKKMTNESVPTIDNVIAMASYGPTGTLFTVGRNHTVQQYDLITKEVPVMVTNVQHVPPNAPPTPPDSIDQQKLPRTVPLQVITSEPVAVPIEIDVETSEDEDVVLSPLQKIAKEMDDLEEERRDQVGPLSPISSRASMSSASSYGRPRRTAGKSSPVSRGSSDVTLFSGLNSQRSTFDSISIRTDSSVEPMRHKPRYASVSSRKDIMRSPDELKQMKLMDLFPYTKSRLSEVKFRAPQYPLNDVGVDVLRIEMLSVVFGWAHDIESLIRDELSRHKPGSASGVFLSKWLGESGADAMAATVASESMTSADWILLALTANMGHGPQRQIGEAFVRRSLEANEIHPAVAILLGLGSQNEAIEVYVSRQYYLEAVLLTCLIFPHDWKRQSHIVRKWGELAVSEGQPELAVRCFSCTSIEPTEAWFSPRSQDLVYQAQQEAHMADNMRSPGSPPSAGSSRLTTKNASLKLITTFGDRGVPKPQEAHTFGNTPIANSAVTPGAGPWRVPDPQSARDLSQTRTATPGGYKKARLPSATRKASTDDREDQHGSQPRRQATPAMSDVEGPDTAIHGARHVDYLPSPNPVTFNSARHRSRSHDVSKDRNHHHLHIRMVPTVEQEDVAFSPSNSHASRGRHHRSTSGLSRNRIENAASEDLMISPALATSNSLKSFKGRSIDRYIESLEEANFHAHTPLGDPRTRSKSRDGRSRSRPGQREMSRSRAGSDVAFINPSKRSPSSPKSMTAEDAGKYSTMRDSHVARDNGATTPGGTRRVRDPSRNAASRPRPESPEPKPAAQPTSRTASRNASRVSNRERTSSHGQENLPRHETESYRTGRHSPPSPAPMEATPVTRSRQRSSSRRTTESRARSSSRPAQEHSVADYAAHPSPDMLLENMNNSKPRAPTRKELAAKELEDRRLSLARRTPIPPPGEQIRKSRLGPDYPYESDMVFSRRDVKEYYDGERSHTVDPDTIQRLQGRGHSGTSTGSVLIGLPATPRAMRHPKFMGPDADNDDSIPAVPALPDGLPTLAPLSYKVGSKDDDGIGPLLPSTAYIQRPVIQRSASTPPERYMGSTGSFRSSKRSESNGDIPHEHSHQTAERDFAHPSHNLLDKAELPNIATTLSRVDRTSTGDQIIVVGHDDDEPPILAELAHLAGPPPPPPPPTMYQPSVNGLPSGIINIAIDSNDGKASRNSPPSDDPSNVPALSTSANRSRHGSVDGSTKSGKSASSKWRVVADRMRTSSSRSRNAKSPGNTPYSATERTSQYSFGNSSSEAIPPSAAYAWTKTSPAPYETAVGIAPPFAQSVSPTGGVAVDGSGGVVQADSPIDKRGVLSASVYRNPREVRANMPPDTLQPGVHHSQTGAGVIEGGMI